MQKAVRLQQNCCKNLLRDSYCSSCWISCSSCKIRYIWKCIRAVFVGHRNAGSTFHSVQDVGSAVSEEVDGVLLRKTTLWCSWRGICMCNMWYYSCPQVELTVEKKAGVKQKVKLSESSLLLHAWYVGHTWHLTGIGILWYETIE